MTELVELGRATTHGQALPLGVDDPIIAARAVRRALAAAGRRALDVSTLLVASNEPIEADVLAAFARRALGPHGASIQATGLVSSEPEAVALATHAVAVATTTVTPRTGLVIAIGIAADGTTEARCLGVGAAGPGG
jgi:hypothetical protein